jgi:hypothetical protein
MKAKERLKALIQKETRGLNRLLEEVVADKKELPELRQKNAYLEGLREALKLMEEEDYARETTENC